MIRSILIAALDAQIAEMTGAVASLQWTLLSSHDGGESLAVVGALLELHEDMERQCWALKCYRADLAQKDTIRC